MRAGLGALDPAASGEAAGRLLPLVFDRLVRLDAEGRPQPALAVSWTHAPDFEQWEFRLRAGVKFQDGSPLAAGPALAAALGSVLPDLTVTASRDGLTIRAPRAAPELPRELGRRGWVFARTADGTPLGTGPFRVTSWEPNRRAAFAANDDYWDGRPFLDAVEVQMNRSLRDQLMDLEVGKADLVEMGPSEARRAADRGRSLWSSAPVVLMAVVFERASVDPRLRQAVALSIDREAIRNVLLGRRGEISGGLLPAWLSGYAFLFPAAANLGEARRLAAALPPASRTLTLGYDSGDPLARLIADRISVNARDAGITLQVTGGRGDLRLAAFSIASLDPAEALSGIAAALGVNGWNGPGEAESLYASERALLEGSRVIPLFYLPADFAAGARLRCWRPPAITRLGVWHPADLWLEGGGRP
jgi:ABC-type transport system substrate-binding protein